MNFKDCVYGRITVGQKKHVWASYQMQNNVWSKKYMIIFNNVGYAISASCLGRNMFFQREKEWDKIAMSFRLIN
jgi:hypothetical protein